MSDENFARVFEKPQKRAKLGSTDQDLMDNLSQSELMELWENSPQMRDVLEALSSSPPQPGSEDARTGHLYGIPTPRSVGDIPWNSTLTEAVRTNAAKKVREEYNTLAVAYASGETPGYVGPSKTDMDVEGGKDSWDNSVMRAYNTTGKDPKTVQLIEPSHDMLVRCIAAIIEAEVKASGLEDSINGAANAASEKASDRPFNIDSLDNRTFDVESTVNRDFRGNLQNREKMRQETMYTYILLYIDWVFHKLHYPPECNIIALTYYYRLAAQANIRLTALNWQNIWVTCISLAVKMWQDSALRSAQIVEVLTGVSQRHIRDMEALLLKLISYQTTISAQVYAECYFALRDMYGELFPDTDVFWSNPLSIAARRRLEQRSQRGQITKKSWVF